MSENKENNQSKSKIGLFIKKVSQSIPEILTVGTQLATGNIGGAFDSVKTILKEKAKTDDEANKLLIEFEQNRMTWEREMYELEIADRDSARNREIEIVKAGKFDFMFLATGVSGLASFLFVVYAVVYIPKVVDNPLFIHLMGMIEGVVIGNIFAYYYGTSKSSSDKNKFINK